MKFKRTAAILLVAATAATGLSLAACGPDGGGSANVYVMEAEYCALDDVIGAGYSSDQTGLQVIYGEGTEEQKEKWSNGYFVGYTYTPEFSITFEFTADAAANATLALRLGSEIGSITLSPENFKIELNGTAIPYKATKVNMGGPQNDLSKVVFYEKIITQSAQLEEGANTVTLTVLANDLMGTQKSAGGPLIDCLKITTKAGLTLTQHKDNIERRDQA